MTNTCPGRNHPLEISRVSSHHEPSGPLNPPPFLSNITPPPLIELHFLPPKQIPPLLAQFRAFYTLILGTNARHVFEPPFLSPFRPPFPLPQLIELNSSREHGANSNFFREPLPPETFTHPYLSNTHFFGRRPVLCPSFLFFRSLDPLEPPEKPPGIFTLPLWKLPSTCETELVPFSKGFFPNSSIFGHFVL